MKVLIVCSYRDYSPHTDYASPFVYEQVHSLELMGCNFQYLFVKGGGVNSYYKAIFDLYRIIRSWNPDIIHAHGGLCGFICVLQHLVPVITTYHGSDINRSILQVFSRIPIKFSKYNIFVSKKQIEIIKPKQNFELIPCGVDTEIFYPKDKEICRRLLGLETDKIYILFSKGFTDRIKNYPLAKAAVDQIENAVLIELIGYTRENVNLLMNACDVALMTSFSEGSPQFIKEAMACNSKIVSTDVGDVREVLGDAEGCYICSYDVEDVIFKINKCLSIKMKSENNRKKVIENYGLNNIARRIYQIYETVKR